MIRNFRVFDEHWPTAGAFVIARGAKTEAHVLMVEVEQAGTVGRGESMPYPRFGETMTQSMALAESARPAVEAGISRGDLQGVMLAGAARNAIDCALWDLEAKLTGEPAWKAAGKIRLDPVKTCYTLSLDTPEAMAEAARAAAGRPMLKLKIGAGDDLDRVEAVRKVAPRTRLIVDANEGLSFDDLRRLAPELARLGVMLIEQPLKAGEDEALEGYESPVMLCADESLRTRMELDACARRYGCINVKLDKAGGLTEALALTSEARARGLAIMAGCMVATSLAMAPATIIAQGADFVALEGPPPPPRDRELGLVFEGSMIRPPSPELWG